MSDTDCLFCKFVSGELETNVVHNDEHVLAFRDINPQAPTHALIVPRQHVATINDIQPEHKEVVGALFVAAREIAASEGFADDGYRVVMNCNDAAGQTVFHLHLHILGGRRLSWPPG